MRECNASFCFVFLFFCRSIRNTEQGINESCLSVDSELLKSFSYERVLFLLWG